MMTKYSAEINYIIVSNKLPTNNLSCPIFSDFKLDMLTTAPYSMK